MAHCVCPFWVGYILLSPLRKLFENPESLLGPFVREGMFVLEPGCGMGYFTLPLARMVGPQGRVVAVDIQPKMLSVLRRRARKAGLAQRIDVRQGQAGRLDLQDLSGRVDFMAALHMVHEIPDPSSFLGEAWTALKSDGRLLVVEPRHHVSPHEFDQTVALAEQVGFKTETAPAGGRGQQALFSKRPSHPRPSPTHEHTSPIIVGLRS
jgi:ubiquinone/menaquinone biosynthesis C-methylase UbiE